ncbi:DUF3025 domain-containing protein [Jeongeupia naejangsanensis]|uniref:DUF3025 domain-containing protein n=1 Tax=Jeongeupia naejangsanensis TaxID=613195 RepID=A0ABS2BHW7_9NEIS|nr:DUF3025 domain-containing protein [Jeongeupia naejangsanensis]MBM3115070.1 DUF3025 domain-containing protein [Jeongeupia naejangsanensis]
MTAWPATLFDRHPGYAPIRPVLARFDCLPDWQAWQALGSPACNRLGLPLSFVDPDSLTQYYESEIHDAGRIATRHNWHDGFNAAVWHTFPRTKVALNALHHRHTQGNARGPVRDAATLFDECGLIVACSDPALTDALVGHDWPWLFQHRRDDWGQRIEALCFGHANYEYLLAPFRGLTGKCWLVAVDDAHFTLPLPERISVLDMRIAAEIDADRLERPKQLPPLPFLGIPGWWPEQDAAFYADTGYFRPKRATT